MKLLRKLLTFLLYLAWLPLALIDFFVALTAYPLAPVAALFAKDGKLPKLFWYLETYDNPIEGDKGHIARWKGISEKFGIVGRYLQRVAWLWRNKAYNFSYYLMGQEITDPVKWWGTPNVDNLNGKVTPGWVFLTAEKAWCFYAYLPWVKLFGRQFYLRIYLGWKFKGEASNPGKVKRGMLAIFVSPFRNVKL